MAKLPKYLSALHQLSWLCIFQSDPASCRGKIAAIQTQQAGLCLPKPGQLFPGWFWYHSIPRQDSPMRDHWQEDRCSETINISCKGEEKTYWNRVARSRFTARTAEVAASASEKEDNTSAGCERSRPWLCSMLRFLFYYKALYFAQWWCKYKIQSLELLPSLPCLERKETPSHSSAHSPSIHSRFILAKVQLFPRGIESVDSGDKCEWQLPPNAMSECGKSFVKFL